MTGAAGLPPEQEAVRRLLADARHDAPAPPEVVSRLAETLDSLVAERGAAPSPGPRPADVADTTTGTGTGTGTTTRTAPVVDLAARRRRRAGLGLLAAAAVVVAGVALGQGLTTSGDSASDAGAGTSAAQEAPSAGSEGTAPEQQDSTELDAESGAAGVGPELLKSPAAGQVPEIALDDPALADVLAGLRPLALPRSASLGTADALGGCALPALGAGRRVALTVDGQVGTAVFRRPTGATQRVDVFTCGAEAPVQTVTLPAP